MQNLLIELTRLLEQDDRLVSEGKLLKNKIVELAGVLVFDKIKFQQFVSNKQFLPDSYTAFKNKIGLTVDGEYLTENKEVVLAWPYKGNTSSINWALARKG